MKAMFILAGSELWALLLLTAPTPAPAALRLPCREWTRVLLLQQLLVELMDLLDPGW
jgi:hypothetical protein